MAVCVFPPLDVRDRERVGGDHAGVESGLTGGGEGLAPIATHSDEAVGQRRAREVDPDCRTGVREERGQCKEQFIHRFSIGAHDEALHAVLWHTLVQPAPNLADVLSQRYGNEGLAAGQQGRHLNARGTRCGEVAVQEDDHVCEESVPGGVRDKETLGVESCAVRIGATGYGDTVAAAGTATHAGDDWVKHLVSTDGESGAPGGIGLDHLRETRDFVIFFTQDMIGSDRLGEPARGQDPQPSWGPERAEKERKWKEEGKKKERRTLVKRKEER